jgi:hypothetical protein
LEPRFAGLKQSASNDISDAQLAQAIITRASDDGVAMELDFVLGSVWQLTAEYGGVHQKYLHALSSSTL